MQGSAVAAIGYLGEVDRPVFFQASALLIFCPSYLLNTVVLICSYRTCPMC